MRLGAHGATKRSGYGAVMINKILGIRRIGWRIQPIRHWRENKKPRCGDGFDNVLNDELKENEDHENRTVQRQFPKL